MTAYLVADIGGTNARCALASADPVTGSFGLRRTRIYKCSDFVNIDRLLLAYRDDLGEPLPAYGCLAVAGPVNGDRITLTNNDWNFSTEQLRRRLGFERLSIVNDLAAVAVSTRHLGEHDLLAIRPGRHKASEPRVVVGAGTGLGVASLVGVNGSSRPIASEAGHSAFAPADKKEIQLLEILQSRHGYVSWESLLSGTGLVRIYEALGVLSGQQVDVLEPIEITRRASENDDAICVETARVFSNALARFASDAALWFCAIGGVYLAGDICRSLRGFIGDDFLERFSQKGVMTELLCCVPVSLILVEQPGLIGAAACAKALDSDLPIPVG